MSNPPSKKFNELTPLGIVMITKHVFGYVAGDFALFYGYVNHGGNTDAAGQYQVADGVFVTTDQADIWRDFRPKEDAVYGIPEEGKHRFELLKMLRDIIREDIAKLHHPGSLCYGDHIYGSKIVAEYGVQHMSELYAVVGEPTVKTEIFWK